MGILDAIKGKLGDYLFKVGLKRAGGAAVSFILALLANAKVASALSASGVSVDQAKLETFTLGAVMTLGVWLHDLVRTKFPNLHI